MKTPRGESIELHLGDGRLLRTDFVWRDDRFAHRVTVIEPAGERTLLASIEGEPDQPWPPSPAFQQLNLQGEGDQQAALLVGMAGKSHWSMSVEATPNRRGFVFDVACRLNTVAGTLGSCYQAADFELVDPSHAVARGGTGRGEVALDDGLSPNAQSLSLSSNHLQIACAAAATPPYTARWKYAVTLA